MADLLLENSKIQGEKHVKGKRMARPIYSSGCAIAMMSGLVLADSLNDVMFLFIILSLSLLFGLTRLTMKNESLFGALLILAFFIGGFASFIEQLRYDRPLITKIIDITINAKIDQAEQQSTQRWRLWLTDIETTDNFTIPLNKIRVVIDHKEAMKITKGDRIKASVRLFPLSGPLFLGWPDYSRKAWAEGIDATGYARKAVIIKSDSYHPLFLDRLRDKLVTKIDKDLSPQPAVIAKALLLGQRDRRDVELWSDFRKAGLSHLLAISGLHMGLFCFGVYLLIRIILVIDLKSAAYVSHHKWAAILALLTGLFYLLLAHHPISAIRAYMMAFVILVAIITDRRTITMRNLNIVFMLFLMVAPSSLYQPSFQLSFAATYGIIMLYNSPIRMKFMTMPLFLRMVGLLLLTSSAAIISTFPISAYHFGSFSIWGLIANIAAIPLTAMVIMPLAVGYLLLSFLHLQFFIADLFNLALTFLIMLAHEVASLPYSDVSVKMPTPFLLISLMVITACAYLVKNRLRFALIISLLPIFYLWSARDIPIAMAELRGDRIDFAVLDKADDDQLTLKHSFRLSGFWHDSLHKLFVSFDKTQSIKCYYGCDFEAEGYRLIIHNGRVKTPLSCDEKAVHLIRYKPDSSHCDGALRYFIIDDDKDKYLIYRKGERLILSPQKRAPLQKAWRP